MLQVRRSHERGRANHGWLDTRHTFSFAGYYDPKHMGFRDLRVINDDRVAPGGGFPTHGHRDMEIISYVVEGALKHEDSIGTGSIIRPGELQRMTAGTGVTHSEYNPSETEGVRFLQIWVLPERQGLTPGYEQKDFGDERNNKLRLVASQDGREGSVTVHQDISLYATVLDPKAEVEFAVKPGRHAWLQVVRGALALRDTDLAEGDGVAVSDPQTLLIKAQDSSEFLLFDLA